MKVFANGVLMSIIRYLNIMKACAKMVLLALLASIGAAGCVGTRAVVRDEAPRPAVLPVAAPQPPSGIYHTVKLGETVWRIAQAYGVSTEELIEVNKIRDVENIATGTQLFIPGAAKPAQIEPYYPPAEKHFIWPARGRITSKFNRVKTGKKRRHDGIDIAVPNGTPVKAAMSGRVRLAGWVRGYGNTVIIDHGGLYSTLYGHNSALLVKDAQIVKQGDVVARSGNTGHSSGPHLHFEIRKNGVLQDPLGFLGVRDHPEYQRDHPEYQRGDPEY